MTTVDRRDIPHPAHVRAGPQFSQRRSQREGSFRKVKDGRSETAKTSGATKDIRAHVGATVIGSRGEIERLHRDDQGLERAAEREDRRGRLRFVPTWARP